MEICVQIYLISTFYLFLVFSQYFIIYINFAHIVASTQQLMTSQNRSHKEYWIQTYNICVLISYSKV